jgi:hypothetical protein
VFSVNKRYLVYFVFLLLVVAILTLPFTAVIAQVSPSDLAARSFVTVLADPPQPVQSGSVARTGNPGTGTYYYWIVTTGTAGKSNPAGPFIASAAPATLDSSNFFTITWTPVPNAVSYDVLRTTTLAMPTGACACAITGGTGLTSPTKTDQTNSLGAYTVSTLDPSSLQFRWLNLSSGTGASLLSLFQGNSTSPSLSVSPAGLVANRTKYSGTTLVVADVAKAGWGTTSSQIVGANSKDAAGTIEMDAQGAGPTANATITITFHDGTWTNAPFCVAAMVDGTGTFEIPKVTSTATTLVITRISAPVAGLTYFYTYQCEGAQT